MELKRYQTRALDQLRHFLEKSRSGNIAAAYAAVIARAPLFDEPDDAPTYAKGSYTPVEGLEGVPYCCLRLPTGGGKTLLASHTIKVAAESWMDRARVPVIWLVPSSTIQTQTIDALKTPRHPYRLDLRSATVLRIQDAGTIRRYENGSREVSGPVSALMDMIHNGDLPERFNPVAPG